MRHPSVPSRNDPGAADLRRLLLLILTVGILGVAAELILLEHYDERTQWIPLVLLAVAFPVVLLTMLRPGPRSVLALRVVMAAFVVAGFAGLWFHFQGNLEFELERGRGLAGMALLWETVRGATPALAPGTMVQIGLFGLLATWKHPALNPPTNRVPGGP